MAEPLTREEFATLGGRARAWRELMIADHGAVRLLLRNTHEIAPGRMWRTMQPAPFDIARYARGGIKTIVNLRGDTPSAFLLLEEDACARHEIALVNYRAYSRDAPSKALLHGARDLFARIAYPALMHCKSGADRVGLMSTLYLFLREGVPFDQALGQLSWRYGHVRQGKTGVIDAALEAYLAHARERRLDLRSIDAFYDWVDQVYDPIAVKADFLSSWWGRFLTEAVLRRE